MTFPSSIQTESEDFITVTIDLAVPVLFCSGVAMATRTCYSLYIEEKGLLHVYNTSVK